MANPSNSTKPLVRGLLNEEQFKMRLDGIEAVYFTASQSAKALQMLPHVTARETAMQRNQNTVILNLISQLEIESGILVAYTDAKTNPIGVPFPPILKRGQSERNFLNGVGI